MGRKIKKIEVIHAPSVNDFKIELGKVIDRFQGYGFETEIQNPHLAICHHTGNHNYVALIIGYETTEAEHEV